MQATIGQQLATPEELAGRIFESAIGAIEVMSIYLGDRLGYYKALADGPKTAVELAYATNTNERYTREWLEQQATAQILAVDGVGGAAESRRYSLPDGYEAVLVDELSPAFVAPIGRLLKVTGSIADQLVAAYRSGGGISWEEMGPDAREAQAAFNRPFFAGDFLSYIRQVPGVDAALSQPGSRVAEIGCGGGHALIAMAQAYPGATGDGFDLDGPTVEMARAHVREAGLDGRVAIHQRDAGDPAIAGSYDLVAALECVHDLSDPVAVLGTMKRLAKPGGTVLVMDERVAEEFGAFGDPIERLMYGASIFICLPDGMSHQPSAATGTVMRPSTLEGYAKEAGFSAVEVLPLEHDMFRFYRLVQ